MDDIQLYYYEIKAALRKCREAEYSQETVEHAAGLIRKLYDLVPDPKKKAELKELLKMLVQKRKEAIAREKEHGTDAPITDVSRIFPLIKNEDIRTGILYNVTVIESNRIYQDNTLLLYGPFPSELSYAVRCYAKQEGKDIRFVDCEKIATVFSATAPQIFAGLYKQACAGGNEVIVYEKTEGMAGAESVEESFAYYLRKIRQECKTAQQFILATDKAYAVEKVYAEKVKKLFPEPDVLNTYLNSLSSSFIPLVTFRMTKGKIFQKFSIAEKDAEAEEFIKAHGLFLGYEGLDELLGKSTACDWKKFLETLEKQRKPLLEAFIAGFEECTFDFLDWDYKIKRKPKRTPTLAPDNPILHPVYKLSRTEYDDIYCDDLTWAKVEKIMNTDGLSLRLKCGWVVNCAVDIASMGITGLTPEHAQAKMTEYWELAYAALQQLMKIPHGKMVFDIEEGDTLRGQCCDGGQTMRMNAEFINAGKLDSLGDGRGTLLHEAFHALQFSAIDAFQNGVLDKSGYYLVHFDIYKTHADQWRINFSRYRDSKKDFNLYEDQVVEAHARIFAANCLAEFEEFKREKPEIINEVNAMRL